MPANVTTVLAEDLRARLVLAADHDEAIFIDASETETVGQAALQLLIAAQREAARLGLPFVIENMRPELVARIARLGFGELLGLSTAEEIAP
ncbi:STAS domain-containing protein [Sphingobium subterraneum]|uniref:STAS domain-containing protein n=1 Tax=Sphingobium subterraneum TaxID=627688 RepID=UPI001FE68E32|nr:STAS domain-containing protein [Sphingobium subterraneum]